jgi:hypothetical protein
MPPEVGGTEVNVSKYGLTWMGKPEGDNSSASVERSFSSLQKKLRVERSRMINGLTGEGNVTREQSMLAERQPWKSAYRVGCRTKDGMAKAGVLETQSLGLQSQGG